jgi:hypothetical protein
MEASLRDLRNETLRNVNDSNSGTGANLPQPAPAPRQ